MSALTPPIYNNVNRVTPPTMPPGTPDFEQTQALSNVWSKLNSAFVFVPAQVQGPSRYLAMLQAGTFGMHLRFARGIHYWPPQGLTIGSDQQRNTLCGGGNGVTVWTRAYNPTAAYSAPMLTIEGQGTTIRDVAIVDTTGWDAGQPAIKVTSTGDNCTLENVWFTNATVLIDGADRIQVLNCRFGLNGASTSVEITGTCGKHVLIGNIGSGYSAEFIYAGDNVSDCTFTANMADGAAANCVSYKAPGGSVAAGNIGVVTARP